MKRCLAICLIAAWSCAHSNLSSAAYVITVAGYFVETEDPNNPRTAFEEHQTHIAPQTASVSDPLGKADGSASATYGVLTAAAEIDPDIGGGYITGYGSATFSDELTITGDNVGETGTAIFRWHVTGAIRQPFIVSEVTGFAEASTEISASSALGGDSASAHYSAAGVGSPVINTFEEVMQIRVPFTVGDTVSLTASLSANAEASGLNVDPSQINFSALFDHTARLTIMLQRLANPHISSQSGTNYEFVPEPMSAALLALGLSALPRRRS